MTEDESVKLPSSNTPSLVSFVLVSGQNKDCSVNYVPTVAPQYNERPRDWQNEFVIKRL